jgi:hypothetical protein
MALGTDGLLSLPVDDELAGVKSGLLAGLIGHYSTRSCERYKRNHPPTGLPGECAGEDTNSVKRKTWKYCDLPARCASINAPSQSCTPCLSSL